MAGIDEMGDGTLDVLQVAGNLPVEVFTRFGQRQAPSAALEQAGTQIGLQAGDVLADRGRGNA
ncbi:hypothetical protein D9M68_865240 [compost metagenome]